MMVEGANGGGALTSRQIGEALHGDADVRPNKECDWLLGLRTDSRYTTLYTAVLRWWRWNVQGQQLSGSIAKSKRHAVHLLEKLVGRKRGH
jgi:hypothetical protein